MSRSVWVDEKPTEFAHAYPARMDRDLWGTPGVEREQNGNAGRASGLRQPVDVRRTNDGQSINN
jgi:hypothetical protein